MDYQKLRNELKEIVSTAESVPEKYREMCFEILFGRLVKNIPTSPEGKGKQADETLPTGTKKPTASDYENIIAIEGDAVKIIQNPPGKKTAEKNVNLALLYLYGKELLGQKEAKFSEIRNLCEEHSCLDSPNFAKNLKREKSYFIFSGKERSQTIKLTVPGRTKASSLVAELNNQ